MVLKILLVVKIISQKMLNRKYFLYFHINDMNSIVASVYPYLYCSSLLATLTRYIWKRWGEEFQVYLGKYWVVYSLSWVYIIMSRSGNTIMLCAVAIGW